MINILSKQDRRHLIILETLFNKKSSTLRELTQLTRANRKTIQEDFQKINELIDKPMAIATSLEGCALMVPEDVSNDYIYTYILTNSLEFSILELFFFEKYQRLEEYADALFISLSTLKRTITRINKELKKYGFQIKTGPNQIIGQEEAISNTFINFFAEKYTRGNYPFSSVQLVFLDKIIQRIVKKQELFLNFADLEKLKLLILTGLVRIQNGHHTKTYEDISLAEFDVDIIDDFLLRKAFKSVFKIEMTENNLIRLFHPLVSGDFVFNYQDLIVKTQNNPQKMAELANIQQVLSFIKETFKIPLNNQEKIELELYNLSSLAQGSNFLLYNRKRSFINNLVVSSPLVNKILNETTDSFFNTGETYTREDIEQYLYTLIIHWPELAFEISIVKPVFKMGVFMTADVEHSQFITDLLNQLFLGRFEVSMIVTSTLNEAQNEFSSYDLILTNLSKLKAKGKPVICINLYPSQDDLRKIAEKYGALSEAGT